MAQKTTNKSTHTFLRQLDSKRYTWNKSLINGLIILGDYLADAKDGSLHMVEAFISSIKKNIFYFSINPFSDFQGQTHCSSCKSFFSLFVKCTEICRGWKSYHLILNCENYTYNNKSCLRWVSTQAWNSPMFLETTAETKEEKEAYGLSTGLCSLCSGGECSP